MPAYQCYWCTPQQNQLPKPKKYINVKLLSEQQKKYLWRNMKERDPEKADWIANVLNGDDPFLNELQVTFATSAPKLYITETYVDQLLEKEA